ncbi:peptidylprolyl isomerase [Streptomyces sp. NPDC051907]|uniref:peptidylprolyl isomerase n=1 Tax=Streptomyces sp. NPDC051907 TaxID=3155284 RepID=UPI0034316BD2
MVSSDQRRRQLAREKFERQQQRRTEAKKKAKQRNAVIAAVLAVVLAAGGAAYVLIGLADGDDAAKKKDDAPTADSGEPAMAIDKKAKYSLDLTTDRGEVSIAMDAAKTPHTVNSFKSLADKGYFNGTKCHRLTTEGIFVLQCGDPKGNGQGGPGYNIPDENLDGLGKAGDDGKVAFPAGTVAMANTSAPNTGGSQFFLVYKDSRLPPTYTPFGKMDAKGLKAVQEVAKAGVDGGGSDGAPKTSVTLEKAAVPKV